MSLVTTATIDNAPEIVALCYRDFDEVGSNLNKPDTHKSLMSMIGLIENGQVFIKKDEETDQIIGFLALTFSATWWSDTRELYVAVIYIVPEKRTYKLFNELIDAGKEFAEICNTRFFFEVPEKDLDRKIKLLGRKGFERVGALMRFDPLKSKKE